jgi:hypothetical protein
MRKKITLDTDYEVSNSNKDIILSVVIGNGQPGTSVINLDNVPIQNGIITDFPIGKSKSLKGKTLNIFSTVSDENINTNKTSITYLLTGGEQPKRYYLHATVDIDKDTIEYSTNIKFI